MLTALIIAWIVILVVGSAVAGFRGFRVFKRVKRLQAEVERQLPPEKIAEVQARAEALKVKQAELQAALDSLNRATAQVKIVRDRLGGRRHRGQVRPPGIPAVMRRVAAVDQGTNSTRLLVADVDGDRVDEVRAADHHPARRRSRLERPAGGRVDQARDGRARPLRPGGPRADAEVVLMTATSAVRDADNGPEFLAGIERTTASSPAS